MRCPAVLQSGIFRIAKNLKHLKLSLYANWHLKMMVFLRNYGFKKLAVTQAGGLYQLRELLREYIIQSSAPIGNKICRQKCRSVPYRSSLLL